MSRVAVWSASKTLGNVNLAIRRQRLKVRRKRAEIGKRSGDAGEEDGEVEIAVRPFATVDRGAELQEQQDAVAPGDVLETLRIHAGVIDVRWVPRSRQAERGAQPLDRGGLPAFRAPLEIVQQRRELLASGRCLGRLAGRHVAQGGDG